MIVPVTGFELDMLMALRFAYYVQHISILPDHVYDAMEAEYELVHGQLLPGSENPASYTDAQRALALYFVFSGRYVKPPAPNPEDLL